MVAGDYEAAVAAGAEAVAIGERFGEPDLFALAAQDLGILLIRMGRVEEGLRLLDEAMVAVTAGELSPIVNGFVYCGVIMGCQAAYEPRRAQEWTAALTAWCERQPDMVSFTGTCLVHRAEIMQLHGAWPDALEEARRARERCALAMNESAAAEALYRQGEVHRLRGDFAAAEDAYGRARRGGREPQPGLALLRLAEGNGPAPPPPRSAGSTARPPSRRRGPGCSPRTSRSCWRSATSAPHGRRRTSSRRSRQRWHRRDGRRHVGPRPRRRRAGRGRPAGGARRAAPRVQRVARAGRAVRAGADARADRTRLRRARRRRHRARRSSKPRARSSWSSARRPTWRGSARSRHATRIGLTPRELQVLRLVAVGKSNREIAVGARHQRAHRRPAPAEHLREARRVVADRRERVRVVRIDHAARPAGWLVRAMARRRARRSVARMTTQHAETTADALAAAGFGGEIVDRAHPRYDELRKVFNGMVDRRPGPDRPLPRRARRLRGGPLRPLRRPAAVRLRRRPQRHRQRRLRRRRDDRPAADEGRRRRSGDAHLPRRGRAHVGRARRRDPAARPRRDRRARVHDRHRRADPRRRLGLDRAQVRLRGREPARGRGRHGRRSDPDRVRDRAPGALLGDARRRRQLRRGDPLRAAPAPGRPDRRSAGCCSTRPRWPPTCCATSATSWRTLPTRSAPGSRWSPGRPGSRPSGWSPATRARSRTPRRRSGRCASSARR